MLKNLKIIYFVLNILFFYDKNIVAGDFCLDHNTFIMQNYVSKDLAKILNKIVPEFSCKDSINNIKEIFENNGFTVMSKYGVMVGRGADKLVCFHDKLPDFVLKISVSKIDENGNPLKSISNISRVIFSKKLNEYIKNNNLQNNIGVPEKFLYKMQNRDDELLDSNYIVVAQKINTNIDLEYIVSEQDRDKIKEQYNLTEENVKLIEDNFKCMQQLLNNFSYQDIKADNFCVAPDYKVYLIDTEVYDYIYMPENYNLDPMLWDIKF